MNELWRLGGLSPAELLRRTARECWDDDLFGLAARLAFYHFLAIFPILALLLFPLARLHGGADMRGILTGSLRQFLPSDAAVLLTGAIQDLNHNVQRSGVLLIAAAGAVWAGFNASWAMIAGLNTAYECREDRPWRDIAGRAAALGLAVVLLVLAALLATHYVGRRLAPSGSPLAHLAQWFGIVAILQLSFALFYRFGPNLQPATWRWSTPGAIFGTALWVVATLAVQFYFDRLASQHEIYGRLAATASLMIWLYVTSATVLIGAELNAEIEKAAIGPRKTAAAEPPPREPSPEPETPIATTPPSPTHAGAPRAGPRD